MKIMVQPVRPGAPLRDVRLILAPEPPGQMPTEAQLKERYEQGFRDGEKALGEQLLQQRNELLQLQQGVFNSLRQCLSQVRLECERTLVGIALEAARKLVAGLPITPELIEATVREAIDHCEATQELIVFLQADDLELLQRVNAPLLLATAGGEKLRFQTSPEVTRGGCLVQTRFGTLDARRETKLELLAKSLQA